MLGFPRFKNIRRDMWEFIWKKASSINISFLLLIKHLLLWLEQFVDEFKTDNLFSDK